MFTYQTWCEDVIRDGVPWGWIITGAPLSWQYINDNTVKWGINDICLWMYIPICLYIFVDDAITNMDLLHENDWLRLAQRPTDTLDKPLTHADLAVNESHTWIKQAFHITTQARPFLSQNGNLLSLSANNYGKTLFCIWAFWIRKLRDYQRVQLFICL